MPIPEPFKRYIGGITAPFDLYRGSLDDKDAGNFWDYFSGLVRRPGDVIRGLVLLAGKSKEDIERSFIILAVGVQESRYLYNAYMGLPMNTPIPQGVAVPFKVSREKARAALTIRDGEDEVHKRVHKAFERHLDRSKVKKKIKLEKDKGKRRLRIFGRRSSPETGL